EPIAFMTVVHRRAAEIDGYITNRRRQLVDTANKAEQRRLDFLIGKIKTEEQFQTAIFRDERAKEKKEEEIQILSTFLAGVIERFTDFVQSCTEEQAKNGGTITSKFVIKQATKFMKDVKKIVRFCNQAFESNFLAMSYKKFPQICLTSEYSQSKLFTKRVIIGHEEVAEKVKKRVTRRII
ncbi:MAG TPA: hypothetical protein PKD85_11525, partial [Saprospiraceae bacterium]|nr:hypothetical protein [Saprospiraceae bacterium]